MNNAYQVAREIISQVCASTPADQDADFEAAVNERFPMGKGGVGHAQRRMRAAVLAEIKDFYAPREAVEPDARYGW